jgi:Flp pilus assembly protein TadG
MRPREQHRAGADAGAAAVEGAVIMSTLLLAVVGTVEVARALWTYNTMLLAVQQASRYAMTYRHHPPAICAAQSQASDCPALSDTPVANCSASYARAVLSAYRAPPIGVSVVVDTAATPPTTTVCASYSFDFLAPQLLPYGPLALTTRVTVPLI